MKNPDSMAAPPMYTASIRIPETMATRRSRAVQASGDVRPRIDNPIGPTCANGTRNAHHTLHHDPTSPITANARRSTFGSPDVHQRPAKMATAPAR